jgi:DivIVA domain-containing protein
MEEVDAFVLMVEEALVSAAPRIRSTDVAECRFTPVQFKPGYDMAEVDAYLDRARRRLRDREHDLPPSQRPVHAGSHAASTGHCPGCRCAELGLTAPGHPGTP